MRDASVRPADAKTCDAGHSIPLINTCNPRGGLGRIGILMSTLFLSYARGDDEPFVERLHHDLSAHGFDVWWDRVSMPGRALTFLQEIRDAITAARPPRARVGPKAVTSDYVRAEWLYALEIGKAINPVLRLGDYDLLPDELKLLDAPDFRDDGHYAARLETLVRQLSEPVAPMGKLIAVPSLPPHFLRRPDRLRALKDAVLADLHRPVVITGTAPAIGIHGMGGIGKSVLASALAATTRSPGVSRRRVLGRHRPEADARDPPAPGSRRPSAIPAISITSRRAKAKLHEAAGGQGRLARARRRVGPAHAEPSTCSAPAAAPSSPPATPR